MIDPHTLPIWVQWAIPCSFPLAIGFAILMGKIEEMKKRGD